MLNLALKVTKAASVLRSCEKPIFYTGEYKGNLKDKAEIEELTVGSLKRLVSGGRRCSGTTNNQREGKK